MRAQVVESSSRRARSRAPRRLVDSSTRLLILAALVALAPHAFACSVCYGAPGDPMVKGANSGIAFLLGIVAFVQIGFVAMFWSFWRKARDQKRFRDSLRVIEGGPRS